MKYYVLLILPIITAHYKNTNFYLTNYLTLITADTDYSTRVNSLTTENKSIVHMLKHNKLVDNRIFINVFRRLCK